MRFARSVFLLAGIYGMLVIAPLYFLEAKTGRDNPPAITPPEFFYGFIGVALAWQILFLILSRDPARCRVMILSSVLEKTSFGVAAIVLYLQGRLATQMLGFGLIDLLFAALFIITYLQTRTQHNQL